ncbi:TIGR00341 family protein [Aurantiacibacter sp. D1-12]|uniref:TIGR00341 family protein n=1 Tax=Aurantiacibacter sp. D1-12 TaxID=2993658 RepID=UPI00237D1C92|nr:TIGR00341 family protein [Aurantiacibacter sp. D1-12]MDE1467557.1 TIGR00341 family protein [Aurantiacibacter sp. D1-12]
MQTPNAPDANSPNTADQPLDKAKANLAESLTHFNSWWRKDVSGTVDQVAVIEKRRAECTLSARYLLMTCMSAGIAILGLLQGSAAVVIGAMLLSPLMDPIMGVGFALAIGDYKWLRQSAKSLAVGTAFAILFCAMIVFFSPLQTITAEIAARTRPTLFDLGVAIFSSIAGAYAMIRGREGTIVGVAIATALMPPLAVVGFGLATFNGTVFWGALFLFITNLTAIALTATAMARAYGFSTSLSDKQTQLQAFLIFSAFVVLAIPLLLSLRQIVWETTATRQINTVIEETFDGRARVDTLDPNYEGETVHITATVLTPEIIGDAEVLAETAISERLGRTVDVSLTQIPVGTSEDAAEEAQLAAARTREAEAVEQMENIADRLALLAGVPTDDVTIDRERRRAIVVARPLAGATMATYRELERRIDATEPEWDIRFTPPLRALPNIAFEQVENAEGETVWRPTAEGRRALALASWAQDRTSIPVRLTGPADSVAALRTILSTDNRSMMEETNGAGHGTVTVSWAAGE